MSFAAAAVSIGFTGVGATIAAGAMMGATTTIAGNVIGGRSVFDNIGKGIITGGITGGLAPGVSEMTGFGIPASAGLIQGGLTTLATGSLSRGLMAGMGAYGMYGLGESVANAGANSLTGSYLGDYQSALAEQGFEPGSQAYGNAARHMVTDARASIPITDKMSAGFDVIKDKPGAFFKDNLKYIGAAAAPIMADAMVPTTTKMPTPQSTGYIRQKVFDPGTQTYRSLPAIAANEWKDRDFSDIYRGYNGGGIVALAEGGDYSVPVDARTEFAPVGGAPVTNNMTVEDLYTQILGRQGEQAGLDYWKQGFGDTVDANEIASFRQAAQAELANRTPAEQLQLAPNLVNNTGIASLGNAGDMNYVARDPGIITATNQYFAANPDVAAAYAVNSYGMTPEAFAQTHYDKYGSTEQRSSPLTATSNSNAYLLANPDVAAAYAKNSYGMTPAELVAYHSTTYGNAEQRATPITEAQNMVANMYRNVLNRDPDPEGLAFWSNAIAAGRSPESIYKDFLASARSNTELVTADQVKNATFADATKAYKGYTSTDASNIVDEWVRNTLGREPTAADKTQQWYKDAFTSMKTQGQAQGLYGQFQTYAGAEAKTETANRIKAIDAELKAKGLTEADLLAQTGKTKQQLATEGLNTDLNWMGASQLNPLGKKTAFDLKAKLAELKAVTTPQTNAPAGTTNPYGNKTNPGDITRNPDGTITVTPNIPGRPYGGFSGMGEVRNAYTQGGGSLGYTSPVVTSADQHDELYNRFTPGGDSEAAYNFLMGKGANPIKSKVGEIAKPYKETALGYAPSTNKAYSYDAATGKMVRNPDYVAPGRDSKGNVTYGMSLSEMKKYLTTNKLSGQALYDWAQENGVSAQDVADATGRKLSEVYAEFRDASKKAAAAKTTAATAATASETPSKEGGVVGYAVGGGLGSLGSYSDGGRLLKGPGDGVSDSIPATIGAKQQPARLADGEFVVPARIVSELGNGSTEAGAKKLYAMMDRVQRARGKTTGKNKVAANSRADKYLPA